LVSEHTNYFPIIIFDYPSHHSLGEGDMIKNVSILAIVASKKRGI